MRFRIDRWNWSKVREGLPLDKRSDGRAFLDACYEAMMKKKLQILVIPQDDGTYLTTCNQDNFNEFFETQILAMIAGADHRAKEHKKEEAKIGRKFKAAKHRRKGKK